jgi:hypothetical protein
VPKGIDAFRNEQRFCPSAASLEANDSSATLEERPLVETGRSHAGPNLRTRDTDTGSRSLSEKGSLAGQTAPRVGFTFRTRETGLWRSSAELPQKVLEERLAGCQRISKGEPMSEEARTLQ